MVVRSIAPAIPPRAALYVRVSSRAQAESKDKSRIRPIRDAETEKDQETSIDTQLAACRTYAIAHGYTVDEADVYREVFSGIELWERPKLTALREAIRRRKVDAVLAYAIDRLARDPVHLGVILSEAEHAGVGVEFVTEPLDASPEGQLIRFVRGYAAKVEHEKIKERTVRGHRARVLAGKPWGARAPYGYHWADAAKSTLLVDPPAAAIVRRIFAYALEGRPLRAIATALSADGVTTPKGRHGWSSATVRKMLCNPVYTGRLIALRWKTVKTNSTRYPRQELRPIEEQVELPVRVEALVSEGDFLAVQDQLARNKAQAPRNNRDPEATLLRGGFARCGLCGRVMTAVHRTTGACQDHRHWYYQCSNGTGSRRCIRPQISAPVLDDAVWRAVEATLLQPELIRAQIAHQQGTDPTVADRAATERALADIAHKQQLGAQALLALSPAAAAPVCAELEVLAQQEAQLREEHAAIDVRQAAWHQAQRRWDDLTRWCQDVAANLTALDYRGRRLALEALGVRVEAYPPDRHPRWEITADFPLDVPQIVIPNS